MLNKKYCLGGYNIYLNQIVGRGNYSTVYMSECVDLELSKKLDISNQVMFRNIQFINGLAIKRIIITGMSDRTKKILEEEIKIMKWIIDNPHPNIIKCYDILTDYDSVYIVMEYCESGDLSKHLGIPFSNQVAKEYFSQLLNGLSYLDLNNITHRDIKPKNILLVERKDPGNKPANFILKIADFGFATDLTSAEDNLIVCGSPLYMAPELFKSQIKDKNTTKSNDIWSLGIVLYEMIFGMHPFESFNNLSALKKFMVSQSEIILPSNKCICNDCENLIKSMLSFNITNRINLSQITNHSWLVNQTKSNKSSNIHIPMVLNKYIKSSELSMSGHASQWEDKLEDKIEAQHNSSNTNSIIFYLD